MMFCPPSHSVHWAGTDKSRNKIVYALEHIVDIGFCLQDEIKNLLHLKIMSDIIEDAGDCSCADDSLQSG